MNNSSRKKTKFTIWTVALIITIGILVFVLVRIEDFADGSITNIRLPKSEYGVPFKKDCRYEMVYVLNSSIFSPPKPILVYYNMEMDEKQLIEELNIYAQGYEGHKPNSIVLVIDDNIEMQYVNYLRYAIQTKVIYRTLYYAVVPVDAGMNYDYYIKYPEILYKSKFSKYPNVFGGIGPIPRKSEIENIIQINQDNYGTVKVDGEIIGKDSLLNHLKTIVLSDSGYMMFADIDKSVDYSDYIKLYNAVYGCFSSIRDDLAHEIWKKPFQELSRDKQRPIQKKRPFAYIEEYEFKGNPFE